MKKIPAVKIASLILALAIIGGVSYYIYILFPHVPRAKVMIISSDEDFDNYNLSGSGTEENPFRIENKELGVNSKRIRDWYDAALDISNTTKFFIVIKCTFYGGLSCIKIADIAPNTAQIIDNQIFTISQAKSDYYRPTSGISIYNSIGVNFSYNTFNDPIEYSEGFRGVFLSNVSNTIIASNKICNFRDAILIENSENVTISNNYFSKANYHAFCIEDSTSINIENNYINSTSFGVDLIRCYFSNIVNNTFNMYQIVASDRNAIFLYLCENIQILGNTINQAWIGIISKNSSNCLITLNLIQYSSEFCVQFQTGSHNCTVYHNSFIVDDSFSPYWSQAYDEGFDNYWYDSQINEGNYWSDLGTDSIYVISGPANSTDLYPHNEPFI